MYNGAITCVKTSDDMLSNFQSQQTLSPYPFDLVMDRLTKDIQDEVSWCM